jgi:predicted HD superfamily hydrolase involved in NAD metabolism
VHYLFEQLTEGTRFTGDMPKDVRTLFLKWDLSHTLEHCMRVSREAHQLARRFSINADEALVAGLLHDISDIVPISEMVALAEALKLDVLPEERVFPPILHQRLSAEMAREIFRIDNRAVLSAIGCHTTLKKGASSLDKVVFLADKTQWDQPSTSPLRDAIQICLDKSLDAAALCYLNYLWERRSDLGIIHPWMREAREELLAIDIEKFSGVIQLCDT